MRRHLLYRTMQIAACLCFCLGVGCAGTSAARNPAVAHYRDKPAGGFYSPFSIAIEPMERLLLVPIEKDPDELYVGFEPQVFDDEQTGKGVLVIAYRQDGYVDVYHEFSLKVEGKDYGVVGKGLGERHAVNFPSSKFEVGPSGVNADIRFRDKNSREIRIHIEESAKSAPRVFALLAPLGSSTAHPTALPLFFINDFYFVRRSGTQAHVQIGERHHAPDSFPLPMDWQRIHFIRYSNDPFIVRWNLSGTATMRRHVPEGRSYEAAGIQYEFAENTDYFEIKRMKSQGERHAIEIDFFPPFPDLAALADRASAEGEFVIASDQRFGIVKGRYQVNRAGSETLIRIHPSGGWVPNEKRWMLRFIYTMGKDFKNWPKTYLWTGRMHLGSGEPVLESRWERIKEGG